MKILVISSSAPFGKGESFVISEVNSVARAGNDVLLFPTILRKGNPNTFELDERVILVAQPSFAWTVFFNFMKFIFTRPFTLVRLLCLVSDRNYKNCFKNFIVIPKALWLSAKLRNESVDHIHAHWLTTPSTLAMVTSRLTGINWSVTAHRGDIVVNNLLNEKFSSASFVRFISKSGVVLAKDRALLSDAKIRILHLGVNISDFSTSDGLGKDFSNRKLTILCPANLIPVKGHSLLFKAVSVMRNRGDVNIIVAGDGELRGSLEQTVRNLSISQLVRFEGHVPHSTLISWYNDKKIDLVVLPSQDLGKGLHEGIPVSLMEAMASRIPVVSTSTGGIPELLQGEGDERFGELVDPHDHIGLAKVLDDLVESYERRRQLAELGFQRVFSEFNQEKTVNKLVEMIRHAS
ncbi:glycosyltransferase [Marinobacterium sp. D7]|uniref:glycosyltransferase n=1 Tax=Marinobacterium ramblicola TaxID=2849041 RepID=UPI001C2CFB1B|nr:glycosyltransferase [Marinobacterium ramblicola]MBV1789405.1 glycosyltransferase [Marinobacterium ramblicola]